MIKSISSQITNDEMIRIIDLALRRVVENGESEYSKEEQKIFDKIREIKKQHAKKYGKFL